MVSPGRPATWQDTHRMQRILSGEDRSVMHVHGHWDSPESVILGIRSYDTILNAEFVQAIERHLILSRSILFIGYGGWLAIPTWEPVVNFFKSVGARAQNRHYFLCSDEAYSKVAGIFANTRIYPISYGTHPDLPGFVRELSGHSVAQGGPHTSSAVRVAIGLIMQQEKVVLVHRRQREGALDWQFPAGFVRPLKDARSAVENEIVNETDLRARSPRRWVRGCIRLRMFRVSTTSWIGFTERW